MPNLLEMRNHLRFRLSEIGEGLWTDEDLNMVLNRAQAIVAENLHTPDHPWSSSLPWTTPAISGVKYYVMERNFLSIDNITHWRAGEPNQLIEANIRGIRSNVRDTGGDYWYRWYELRGRTEPYIARGVATRGSDGNTLEDTSHTAELHAVRVGDTVFNENDNDASAIVRNVSNTTITVSDWVGGSNKAFTHGDAYRVAQRERTRDVLWVYPFVDFNGELAYDGSTEQYFNIEKDATIIGMNVTFGTLDPTWNQNSDVRISIVEGLNEVASTSVRGPVAGTPITLHVENFDVSHRNSYLIFAEDVNGNRTSHITATQWFAQDMDNYIELEFVPYPLEMLNDRSICELEEYQLEPCYEQAKKLAWEKKEPDSPKIAEFTLMYERALDKCEETMLGRKAPGPEYIDGQPLPYDDYNLDAANWDYGRRRELRGN